MLANVADRIRANGFLNQGCVLVHDLESMLLREPPQNPFSTVSVKVRTHGSAMARPVYPQQRTYVMTAGTAVECQKATSIQGAARVSV
jgi:hypothetical protein